MNKPKLTLNLRSPTENDGEAKKAVKAAAKRKQAATETIEDAWQRILSMNNSDADQRRLIEVRAAMAEGLIGREPSAAAKRFSKAEALRLWRVLDADKQARRLREMVEEMPDNYWLITDKAKLGEFLALLVSEQEIVFDVETTGTDVWSDYIVGHVISAVKADIHAYIPTKHKTYAKQLDNDYVVQALKPYYEDESIGKIAHNSRFDVHMLHNEGIELRGLAWDTQIAMHVLNENERFQGGSYQLKDLVTKYLRIPSETYDELFGQKGFDEVSDLQVALAYAAKDGDVTLKLRDFQRHHLYKIGLLEYYKTVENPTIGVSIEMERAGFVLDMDRAEELSKKLNEELTEIERGLREHFGDINFNSPAQLSAKFYDELGLQRHLPKGAKQSTDVKTIELLAPHHAGIELLLAYREKTKLLGTYIEALPKQVRSDGRIHGNFNQSGTVTGRFSANNPNLQNQPYFARQLFVAPPGYVILSGDFSQQEPRWLAHYSGEEFLIETYRNGEDLYSSAAAELFGKPIEECGNGSIYRDMMKTGILATMYGTGPNTLANQLDISPKEARDFLDQFHAKYAKVKAWVDSNEAFAKKHGYVEMFMRRKRRLPEARSKDRFEQYRAMRQATNAIIQGSAAIQTKLTMIETQKLCRRKGWTMAFSVHDEQAVYAPEDVSIEDVKEFEDVMLNTVKLKVPNKTDVEISRRWGAGMSVDEWFAKKEETE